jgi:membrane protein DedA with SNARE-associated domain
VSSPDLQIGALGLLHLHIHLHPRGPGIDYIGVLIASGASWAGLPGPGEALLIAAGISAAHHHLDLASIILVAWIGATAGGVLGWIVGRRAGRGVLTAPGPLHGIRLALTASGDRFFARYGVLAVLFTPSWVAGIVKMRASLYLPVNAISAAAWALAIGLGAYWIGPPIADVAADEGLLLWLVVGALVGGFAIVLLRGRGGPPAE